MGNGARLDHHDIVKPTQDLGSLLWNILIIRNGGELSRDRNIREAKDRDDRLRES